MKQHFNSLLRYPPTEGTESFLGVAQFVGSTNSINTTKAKAPVAPMVICFPSEALTSSRPVITTPNAPAARAKTDKKTRDENGVGDGMNTAIARIDARKTTPDANASI